jgi:hypothetical protein
MAAFFALIAIGFSAEPTPLHDKVVAFARSRLGEKVGSGECTALAIEALRFAGAKLPGRGDASQEAWAWGDELKSLRDARPGDILQFENAVFVRRRLRNDGAIETLTFTYPHHTAIVSGIPKRGPKPVLGILHQNAGNGDDRKVVQEWTIDLAEKKSGTVRVYRPSAK